MSSVRGVSTAIYLCVLIFRHSRGERMPFACFSGISDVPRGKQRLNPCQFWQQNVIKGHAFDAATTATFIGRLLLYLRTPMDSAP